MDHNDNNKHTEPSIRQLSQFTPCESHHRYTGTGIHFIDYRLRSCALSLSRKRSRVLTKTVAGHMRSAIEYSDQILQILPFNIYKSFFRFLRQCSQSLIRLHINICSSNILKRQDLSRRVSNCLLGLAENPPKTLKEGGKMLT